MAKFRGILICCSGSNSFHSDFYGEKAIIFQKEKFNRMNNRFLFNRVGKGGGGERRRAIRV